MVEELTREVTYTWALILNVGTLACTIKIDQYGHVCYLDPALKMFEERGS